MDVPVVRSTRPILCSERARRVVARLGKCRYTYGFVTSSRSRLGRAVQKETGRLGAPPQDFGNPRRWLQCERRTAS